MMIHSRNLDWEGCELATESQERRQNESEIRFWASKGMSQRAIARKLHISRPMVQRVLSTSGSSAVTGSDDDSPDDLGEVQSELNAMVESARSNGGLDVFRSVHEAARVCYTNGYGVKYNPLWFLMKLHELQAATGTNEQWWQYHLEIKSVYQDMRDWRICNYAL